MGKINKFNEFLNNEELIITKMIEEGENTPSGNLEEIAERQSYKDVVKLGKKVIPYLLERLEVTGPVWDSALSQLTGKKYERYVDDIGFYHLDVNDMKIFWKNWAKENGY